MKTIDHDPNEPKPDRSRGPWRVIWPIIGLLWIWYFYFEPFNWASIAIGFGTGAILAAWAIEITGNKIPDSWRGKPTSTGGPGTDKRGDHFRA